MKKKDILEEISFLINYHKKEINIKKAKLADLLLDYDIDEDEFRVMMTPYKEFEDALSDFEEME